MTRLGKCITMLLQIDRELVEKKCFLHGLRLKKLPKTRRSWVQIPPPQPCRVDVTDFSYIRFAFNERGVSMKNGITPIKYYKGIFSPYLADLNPDHWCDSFPELMWGLGFEMDCYHSYQELFPNSQRRDLPQKEIEDVILQNLSTCSIQVVGNYIFSRFRELTHWCDYGYPPECADYFFPKAFSILIGKFEELSK